MDEKKLYRITEVAKILSISRSKVYEVIRLGELPTVYIHGSRLIRADVLNDYIESLPSRMAKAS